MNNADLPAIQYTVWPADLHGHRFRVKLHITNPDPNGQILQMPAWIPGSYLIRDFSKHVESLEAFSVTNTRKRLAIKRIDNDHWQLPPTHSSIEVLTTVYAFDSSVRAAYLDTERAFFNATSLCLAVKGQEHLPCSLAVTAPELAFADHWTVQTTLRAAKTDERGFGFYLAKNYDDLLDHPVAMGEFQLVHWKSNGVSHRMAIQGCNHIVDSKRLAEDLQAICSSTIELFEPKTKRAPFEEYLFLVNAVLNGYGGLEHRNSTALLCRRDQIPQENILFEESAYREFLGLCSHEYFHAWLVKRIQPKAFQPYDLTKRNHTRLLWVFEGFTSYYDDLQLLRSKRIDLKTYLKLVADNWNGILRGPGRQKQSLADSSFDAWTKYYQADENTPNAVVSYYGKGALLALGLDLQILSLIHI
jgi:predicted metalloprotease with PDZ domain